MEERWDSKSETPSPKSVSQSETGDEVDAIESQAQEKTSQDEAPPTGKFHRDIHGVKWILTIAAILACVFLFATDTTLVANIQPDIIESLGDFEKFPWLATAYALPGVVLVLIQSKIYGMWNIRWVYFTNFALFELGSAISGAAPTMNSMIVGRAIAGVGGCGIYVGSLTFLSVITTDKERPMYISLITPVWGIGTVLGPVIGGGFAESSVGWRWGFYMNLFLIIVVLPVLIFLLPSITAAPDLTSREKLSRIDWLALVLFGGWCVSFFMLIVFGGSLYPWASSSMIILYIFTGTLTLALILVHYFHPFVAREYRLYPSYMLRNPKLGILQLSVFAAPAAVYIPIFYVPLFFQFARSESPVTAATRLLPFVVLVALASIANGILMSRLGYYMPWFLLGSLLTVIGGALMYTVEYNTPVANIYGYTTILGLGGGCFLMTAFGCVSAVLPDESDVFNAIGVISLAQCVGITLFPALGGCVFQNTGKALLRAILPPEVAVHADSILAGTRSVEYQRLVPELQVRVSETIVEAMGNLYLMTVVVCGVLVLVSPFLGMGRLRT